MTDNEIIKALDYCYDCSANLNFEIINHINRKNMELLDLINIINCQKEEIDSLKSELDSAIKAITPCCLNCKHYKRNQLGDYGCLRKYEPSCTSRCANWKWIGVKESEVENNAE